MSDREAQFGIIEAIVSAISTALPCLHVVILTD
jgi:hypothetical protein